MLYTDGHLLVYGIKYSGKQPIPGKDGKVEVDGIFNLVDPATGRNVWEKEYISRTGKQSFALAENTLLLINDDELEVLSIEKGTFLSKKKSGDSTFAFGLVSDSGTGEVYLESDNVLYW